MLSSVIDDGTASCNGLFAMECIMKGLFAAAAILAISRPTVVMARDAGPNRGDQAQVAQDERGGKNQPNEKGEHRDNRKGERGGPNAHAPATPRANAPKPPAPSPAQGRGNDNRRFENDNRREDNNRRVQNNDRRFDNDRGRDVGRNFNYERDPRAGRDFRFRGRTFVSVRAPRFVYPRGYSYRRWSIGALLPLFFLSAPYYVDWDYIGLPPPPPGTAWVRYGPDALLVDQYTGRVIDEAYGAFY
jgi:Ni/Co efflux regulator RcnB